METKYEEFKHPNMITEATSEVPRMPSGMTGLQDSMRQKTGCLYYFRMFDDTILRPILIYKYARVKHTPEINFDDCITQADNKNKEIGN